MIVYKFTNRIETIFKDTESFSSNNLKTDVRLLIYRLWIFWMNLQTNINVDELNSEKWKIYVSADCKKSRDVK